tara:strand:+ start:63179 stop:63733 length:555 start_codon:yes stop_codon:yes gene_type:complete
MKLTSDKIVTQKLREEGVYSWEDAILFIQKLPYGRNSNRKDLLLVLSEAKGTCSSKHAFLKELANENGFKFVNLYIGVYKMNSINTPKIGTVLSEYNLDHIPEAHCFLKSNGVPLDVTTATSDFSRIENEILEEVEIEPHQVSNYKIAMHQEFLRKWIQRHNIRFTFEEIWNIRERCIQNLTKS